MTTDQQSDTQPLTPARELADLVGEEKARTAIAAGWDAIRRLNAQSPQPLVHPGVADYVATAAILAAVEAGLADPSAAAAHPVPSPEDRMTETPPRLVPTFYTWLDRTEHAQLDARAACAEQERDDARDDLQELKAHHVELHTRLNATENDLRSQNRAVLELAAERDQARQVAGIATDVLATIRDAAERIERALAVYDTTPGEEPEREDDDAQAAIEELTEAVRGALDDGTQGERVEAIRDLLEGWYTNWPETAVTDPNEPLAWELAGLITAAEARASAPSSVPPRRAQEEPTREVSNALAVAYSALNAADKMCRYHGTGFERLGMERGEPRCDSCKQPWRVNRALAAIEGAEARL